MNQATDNTNHSTQSMSVSASSVPSQTTNESTTESVDYDQITRWIKELKSFRHRENSLLHLCQKRENYPHLATMLWKTPGTIAALLQEICGIYKYLNPPDITAQQSNRVCNALALLQCVASHPETRRQFLEANIPLYLYTFLDTSHKTRSFEYLRLTSLGVIGALVKTDEPHVIQFLLHSEIIPLCLKIMECGSELSKTVATFIMQKILLDDSGLTYICHTYERFAHVASVLSKIVQALTKETSHRLLKHVVRCYLRLSDNNKAREALRQVLPEQLKDGTFNNQYIEDQITMMWRNKLLSHIDVIPPPIMNVMPPNSNTSTNQMLQQMQQQQQQQHQMSLGNHQNNGNATFGSAQQQMQSISAAAATANQQPSSSLMNPSSNLVNQSAPLTSTTNSNMDNVASNATEQL